MEQNQMKLPHKLTLSEGKLLQITGVAEVVSFDEEAVVAQTPLGLLTVQGSGLQLKNLSVSGGEVQVEGQIRYLCYTEPARTRRWFGRGRE